MIFPLKYIRYINSKAWIIIRGLAIERAGGKCQRCGRKEELRVHHLNYERLGQENDEDLLVVCSRCHNDIEFTKRDSFCSPIEVLKSIKITEIEYQEYKGRL